MSALGALVLLGALATAGCGGSEPRSPGSAPATATAIAPVTTAAASTSAATSVATPPASLVARVTFTNTQTGASGTCPASLANQKVSGAGTWTLTPRGAGEYDIVAEYGAARTNGRLAVQAREAQITDDSSLPPWSNRQVVSTYRFNETFEQGVGIARVTLTAANGSQCTLTWDLATTFASPLLPPALR